MAADPFAVKRRTGRTIRLVSEALLLAGQGRAVYVIARQAAALQKRIDKDVPGSGIKCEPQLPVGFNWRTMRVEGSHPNCVWLVDHYMIESDPVFMSMFEALTRFDV